MQLTLNNINKGYGNPDSNAFRAVISNLNWKVESGDRIGIIGPSGSGKSTLLNLIGTLDRPDTGKILFNNEDINHLGNNELANFRNRNLGFVFQQHFLLPQITLHENVLLPLIPDGTANNPDKRKWAEYLLRKTGIWEQRWQKPSQLSGGECQRTAVVRAMINKPQLILADEPTGALDTENADILSDLLISLSKDEGVTLIAVTHSGDLAQKLDKVYHLVDGKLSK